MKSISSVNSSHISVQLLNIISQLKLTRMYFFPKIISCAQSIVNKQSLHFFIVQIRSCLLQKDKKKIYSSTLNLRVLKYMKFVLEFCAQ